MQKWLFKFKVQWPGGMWQITEGLFYIQREWESDYYLIPTLNAQGVFVLKSQVITKTKIDEKEGKVKAVITYSDAAGLDLQCPFCAAMRYTVTQSGTAYVCKCGQILAIP